MVLFYLFIHGHDAHDNSVVNGWPTYVQELHQCRSLIRQAESLFGTTETFRHLHEWASFSLHGAAAAPNLTKLRRGFTLTSLGFLRFAAKAFDSLIAKRWPLSAKCLALTLPVIAKHLTLHVWLPHV